MRTLQSVAEAPRRDAVAVIINCGTKLVSSLALASTLRHAGLPVLLVDCESADGSRDHFAALAARHGLAFDWVDWPLCAHHVTLDRLFAEVQADRVLLVDSDVEIADPALVPAMQSALAADERAYGAGFLHGPQWMGPEHGLPPRTGWYAERMWIPLTLLRVAAVREAARRGVGFGLARTFDRSAWLARGLAALGHRAPPPGLHRFRAGGQDARTGSDARPAFVEYDTGARLHADLLAHGWRFAAQPEDRWGGVHHFHGVTRATRLRRLRRLLAGSGLSSLRYRAPASPVLDEARRRLRDGYGIDAGDPDAPVTPAPSP